jgi:hypothetical protein
MNTNNYTFITYGLLALLIIFIYSLTFKYKFKTAQQLSFRGFTNANSNKENFNNKKKSDIVEGFTDDYYDDSNDTDVEDESYSSHPKGKYLTLLFSFLKNILREENRIKLLHTILGMVTTACEKTLLENLEKLWLDQCSLDAGSIQFLSNLKKLTYLNLSNNKLSIEELLSLTKLSSLEKLYIQNTGTDNISYNKLKNSFSNVKIYALKDTMKNVSSDTLFIKKIL